LRQRSGGLCRSKCTDPAKDAWPVRKAIIERGIDFVAFLYVDVVMPSSVGSLDTKMSLVHRLDASLTLFSCHMFYKVIHAGHRPKSSHCDYDGQLCVEGQCR